MSSISLAFFLNCLQISIVKMVELLLNIEVREDMRADIITASIKPTNRNGGKLQLKIHASERNNACAEV